MSKKLVCFSEKALNSYNNLKLRVYKNWTSEMHEKKYDNYINDIKSNLQLDYDDMNFKSSKFYRYVVLLFEKKDTQNIFRNYFSRFTRLSKSKLMNLCKNIDKIGKPVKIETVLGVIDPANVKYIYHAMEILDRAKKLNLNNIDFIEIGGGYGGLAYFIKHISKFEYYDIKINSYTIFDLPEAGKLQKRISDYYNLDLIIADVNKDFTIQDNSFLISNYAFSEIGKKHKNLYMEKVFPYVSHGLLTWNVNAFDINYFENVKADVIEIPYREQFRNYDLRVIF